MGAITYINKLQDTSKFWGNGHIATSFAPQEMLARYLHPQLAVFRRSVSSKAAAKSEGITLSLAVPPSFKPVLHDFESVEAIRDFVKSLNATVRGPNLDKPGHYTIISPRKFKTLSPSITYEILSPGWAGYQGEYHHTQMSERQSVRGQKPVGTHCLYAKRRLEVPRA